MKKLFGLLITIISIVLIGCATTSNVAPSEIEYKEIAGNLYFNSRDADLYSSTKGYKISDVFILGADIRNENGTTEALLALATNAWGNNVRYVYATDFIKNIKKLILHGVTDLILLEMKKNIMVISQFMCTEETKETS